MANFDLYLFFGRFHPLIVHFPIGILMTALLIEVIGKPGRKVIVKIWWIGFLASVFAAASGWCLSTTSTYPSNTLFWHKWIGISITLVSFLIWFFKKYGSHRPGILTTFLRIVLFSFMVFGGHLGGNLTHGENYLIDGAPTFVKNLVGYNKVEKGLDLSYLHIDSVHLYSNLIFPVIESKCLDCHNPSNKRGGLDMSTPKTILEGGENGKIIVPSNIKESEIFNRVTLPQDNNKFMPPKGTPLTYDEIQMLKWWINSGADFDIKAKEVSMSEEIIANIYKSYKVDFTPKPWYENEIIPPGDSTVIEEVRNRGYAINTFTPKYNFLEAKIPEGTEIEELGLENLKLQILSLNLSNTKINPGVLAELSSLKNLNRLQLQNSNVSTTELLLLAPLPRLESINLFGTAIDNDALNHLANFPSLKRIYTWQTKVTQQGIDGLLAQRPDIKVENGF